MSNVQTLKRKHIQSSIIVTDIRRDVKNKADRRSFKVHSSEIRVRDHIQPGLTNAPTTKDGYNGKSG